MKHSRHGLMVCACLALSGCASNAPRAGTRAGEVQVDLSGVLPPEMDATFVLLDERGGRILRYNPARARQRFIPASTFKIPNSLIALETGVAAGPDFSIAYDRTVAQSRPWWPESWKRDQTLRTAIRDSVYWYYQDLARRIGPARMRRYLRQFDYGNMDMSGGIDRFWLDGGLRISPDEQVLFLQRFYRERLGLSARATNIVKEILVLEERPGYRLSGKTGTAELTPTREVAWLVGYVERNGDLFYYALSMEGERVWEDWPPRKRKELVRWILRQLGIIPAGPASTPDS